MIFQHDNDLKHTEKTAIKYLNGKTWPARVLLWPPQSSDLNHIEYLYYTLDSNLQNGKEHISNKEKLFQY